MCSKTELQTCTAGQEGWAGSCHILLEVAPVSLNEYFTFSLNSCVWSFFNVKCECSVKM